MMNTDLAELGIKAAIPPKEFGHGELAIDARCAPWSPVSRSDGVRGAHSAARLPQC